MYRKLESENQQTPILNLLYNFMTESLNELGFSCREFNSIFSDKNTYCGQDN